MNIKNKIMRLFGYENIDNIHIYDNFKQTPPSEEKMKRKRWLYEVSEGRFLDLIVIEKAWYGNWYLKDGYTSYLIAKENNIKYVKVVRV